MGVYLNVSDLDPFATISREKAVELIADAEALAFTVAPCLVDPDVDLSAPQAAAVKAVLRSAVLRWNEAGSGAKVSETAGPFSITMDNSQTRRSLFWPSEIEQLQTVCAAATGASTGGAFTIDTAPGVTLIHAETCSAVLGANYCDCGAVLTGYGPLFGAP